MSKRTYEIFYFLNHKPLVDTCPFVCTFLVRTSVTTTLLFVWHKTSASTFLVQTSASVVLVQTIGGAPTSVVLYAMVLATTPTFLVRFSKAYILRTHDLLSAMVVFTLVTHLLLAS